MRNEKNSTVMGLFANLFKSANKNEAREVYLPKKNVAFDQKDFVTAFDAYMDEQKLNNRGRRDEKEYYYREIKAIFDKSSFGKVSDYVDAYALMKTAARNLQSIFGDKPTVGSTVLNAWADKLGADNPGVVQAYECRKSKRVCMMRSAGR